jgi:hypothetical protein
MTAVMNTLLCMAVILSVVDQSQAFKLQRPSVFRQQTVLFSGDAVEKLHLEPIAKIAGEVRLDQIGMLEIHAPSSLLATHARVGTI